MRAFKNGLLIAAGLVVSPLFPVGQTHATAPTVTVDSAILNGSAAVLAFDFIGGGAPENTVNLSAVVSNGTRASTSMTGNVNGTGPWTFSDAGSSPAMVSQGLSAFMPNEARFSIQVTPQPAPGRGASALLCAGIVAPSVRKRVLR